MLDEAPASGEDVAGEAAAPSEPRPDADGGAPESTAADDAELLLALAVAGDESPEAEGDLTGDEEEAAAGAANEAAAATTAPAMDPQAAASEGSGGDAGVADSSEGTGGTQETAGATASVDAYMTEADDAGTAQAEQADGCSAEAAVAPDSVSAEAAEAEAATREAAAPEATGADDAPAPPVDSASAGPAEAPERGPAEQGDARGEGDAPMAQDDVGAADAPVEAATAAAKAAEPVSPAKPQEPAKAQELAKGEANSSTACEAEKVAPVAAAEASASAEGGQKLDDSVPSVTYDENDKKCLFSKDGRWIIPKREQFPSVFCALRVQVRLKAIDTEEDAVSKEIVTNLPHDSLTRLLKEDLGFDKSFVRYDDCRDSAGVAGARDVVVALCGDLPESMEVGSAVESQSLPVTATVVDILDTRDDMAPTRIASLTTRFKEAANCDAIVFELPQLWIIPDPDFVAKSASIGLYPGSYWMAFFKSWGQIAVADVFFRTVQWARSEPMVHLVLKYRSRESLKMCFTFLHERYLVHPKLRNQLRPPWCRLAVFHEFKARAVGGKASAKAAAARAGAKAAAKAGAKAAVAKTPGPKSRPSTAPAIRQVAPKKAAVDSSSRPAKPGTQSPAPQAQQGAGVGSDDADLALGAAEVMQGLQGRQLAAFQMMMSRVERLEKENQELMQILLQMQGLLQQQQQRNARLAQRAAFSAGAQQAQAARAAAGIGAPGAKRKASQLEAGYPEAPGDETAAEEEDAPWKKQRRRQRRVPAVQSGTGAGSAADVGGLDAYHNALLGV